jgi:hypothetical protein
VPSSVLCSLYATNATVALPYNVQIKTSRRSQTESTGNSAGLPAMFSQQSAYIAMRYLILGSSMCWHEWGVKALANHHHHGGRIGVPWAYTWLTWLTVLGWTSVVKIVTKRNTIKTFCAMWFPQMAKISADMRCTWEDFNLKDTQKIQSLSQFCTTPGHTWDIHRREKINLHFGTCATFCLELQPQRRPSVKFGRSWDVGMSGMLSTSIRSRLLNLLCVG